MVQENGGGGKKRNRNRNKNKNKNKPQEEPPQDGAKGAAEPEEPRVAIAKKDSSSEKASKTVEKPKNAPQANSTQQLTAEEKKEMLIRNLSSESFTYNYAALKEAEAKYVEMMQAKKVKLNPELRRLRHCIFYHF